jgi:hypothetical protein
MNNLSIPLASLSIPDGVKVSNSSIYGDFNNSDGSCGWSFDMNFESDRPFDIGWKYEGDWFDRSGNSVEKFSFHSSPSS